MNSVELDKYMSGSILPLYPDIADTPLKRVIVKVDSGPGRTNIEMHLGVTFRKSQDGVLEFYMVTERLSDLKNIDEYLRDLKLK